MCTCPRVGKGAASTTSQTCVDPHCHPDGPLPLKIELHGPFFLINHYAMAHKYPDPPMSSPPPQGTRFPPGPGGTVTK